MTIISITTQSSLFQYLHMRLDTLPNKMSKASFFLRNNTPQLTLFRDTFHLPLLKQVTSSSPRSFTKSICHHYQFLFSLHHFFIDISSIKSIPHHYLFVISFFIIQFWRFFFLSFQLHWTFATISVPLLFIPLFHNLFSFAYILNFSLHLLLFASSLCFYFEYHFQGYFISVSYDSFL